LLALNGCSPGWVFRLVTRYREEADGAFHARSQRPLRSVNTTPPEVLDHLVGLGVELAAVGLDAGAERIRWHSVTRNLGLGGSTATGAGRASSSRSSALGGPPCAAAPS